MVGFHGPEGVPGERDGGEVRQISTFLHDWKQFCSFNTSLPPETPPASRFDGRLCITLPIFLRPGVIIRHDDPVV